MAQSLCCLVSWKREWFHSKESKGQLGNGHRNAGHKAAQQWEQIRRKVNVRHGQSVVEPRLPAAPGVGVNAGLDLLAQDFPVNDNDYMEQSSSELAIQ